MKMLKKLMALALAGALALTMLTGCSGGGGGVVKANGVTVTIGDVDNENKTFSKEFISALDENGMGTEVSYSRKKGRKAQKLIRAMAELANSNSTEGGSDPFDMALKQAGIDEAEEMIFMTDATVDTETQVEDILDQMEEFESDELEGSLNCDGNTFGYTTLYAVKTGTSEYKVMLCVVVGYTVDTE